MKRLAASLVVIALVQGATVSGAHSQDAPSMEGPNWPEMQEPGETEAKAKDEVTDEAKAKVAPNPDTPAEQAGNKGEPAQDASAEKAESKDAEAKHEPAPDVPPKQAETKETEEKGEKTEKAEPAPVMDAQSQSGQPYMLVRTLETIQDRLTEGNRYAQGFQRRFVAEIAEKMLAAPETVWQDPKNARSSVVYVLSGGDPRVLKKLLTLKSLPEITPSLLKGVLAYAEGRNREVLKYLADVDHRAFENRISCHLALAKATSMPPQDAAKILVLLDDARLLCPGTLAEESALRREVMLLSGLEDHERFEVLTYQYLTRFTKSIYAKNFQRNFAIAVAGGQYGSDPKLLGRLETLLDELGDDLRKELYMALAEEGVIRGRVELTRLAADKIGYMFQDGSKDAIRLQLYKAAALIVTSEYEFAVARLRSIDRTKLSSSDADLHRSALALAEEMHQPPQIEEPIKALPPLSSAAQVKHGAIAEKSEALDAARKALVQADALLTKDRR